MTRDDDLVRVYEEAMGRPVENRFPDDPDWDYRGTKAEREELRERVEGSELIEGQEELFGG